MDIVRNVVNNHAVAKAIDEARSNISEGESIAGPLKASGQFPPIVIHMVNIGEKTGELENMLSQVSDAYDFQVKKQNRGYDVFDYACHHHYHGNRCHDYRTFHRHPHV